jgi:Skp family chaperone for outer membrane proteins
MKKILLVVLMVAAAFFMGNNAQAQQVKFGVFDIDIMVQAMPGYNIVDSLTQVYEQDSLRAEYEYSVKEYNRLDSTYKADSASKAPASVLNYVKDQRARVATQIIYWQQISQQKSEQKRQTLAGPLYEAVITAYSKVLKAKNYTLVLKPNSYEIGSNVENVFEFVAKELKIELPPQLKSQTAAAEEEKKEQPKTTPKTNTTPKKN